MAEGLLAQLVNERTKPLSQDDIEKFKKQARDAIDAVAKKAVAAIQTSNLSESIKKKRINYVEKRAEYKKKAIDKVKPNGLPVLIFILLCSTPDCKGGCDSSCGGFFNEGAEDYFDNCDSTIAVNNIINTLVEMKLIQLVDDNAKTKCDANNARACELTREEVKEMGRWSCPAYTDDEADLAAQFIKPYLKLCMQLNVPTIVIEAGGVTRGSSKVVDKLDKNDITLLMVNLWHIQFFNRVNTTIKEQIRGMSNEIGELSNALGVEQDPSFEDIMLEKAKFSRRTVDYDARSNASADYHLLLDTSGLSKEQVIKDLGDIYDESTMKWLEGTMEYLEQLDLSHLRIGQSLGGQKTKKSDLPTNVWPNGNKFVSFVIVYHHSTHHLSCFSSMFLTPSFLRG